MPYTPEMFNRYNQRVEESCYAVCRHIQYLLKPDDGYPKGSDARLKELYNAWRAECRAMDAALEETVHLVAGQEMIEMPTDDEEHALCRRVAAVTIERNIFGEHNAEHYLPSLIEQLKVSDCWKHPKTCACHSLRGWTYGNQELVSSLEAHYVKNMREAAVKERTPCAGWRDCTCGCCSGGGAGSQQMLSPPPLRRTTEHVVNCACSACYNKRVADGTQDAYMASLRAETDKVLAREYPYSGGAAARQVDISDDFVKNLFKVVQGVEYDSKCPHGLPFYACMPCSH
jgi:hypothetical protein